MRLALLSRGDGWHVQDLVRAATALHVDCQVLDFRTLAGGINGGGPLAGYDAVLVRTMPAGSLEQIVFRMDLLHAAHERGQRVLNTPKALECCIDKFLTSARLYAAGVPTPRTIACQTLDVAMEAFDTLGGDVVVKPLFGSEGRGLVRVTDREVAWRTFHSIQTHQGVIYIQEFRRHPGWDVRAFVIAGEVIAAMKRSNRHDWRTNVAQGGIAEEFTLHEELTALALRAAAVVGAHHAGVDLLPTTDGWQVIEINAVPGWKALSTACDVDIAQRLVSRACAVSV
jgi:ribosomal protein S6--L-glutamate ligase